MFNFSIQFHPSVGRHAVALDHCVTDQIILSCTGLAFSISDSFKKKVCAECLKTAEKYWTIKCVCDQLYFCSSDCQKLNQSKNHSRICAILRKLATFKAPSHDKNVVKLLIMILHQRKELPLETSLSSLSITGATEFEDASQLQSHYHEWTKQDQNDWAKMKRFIIPLLIDAKLEIESQDEFMHWISRIESNGFGLWGRDKNICMGRAIFPLASYFNHSCDPNCVCEQIGNTLTVKALQPIDKGSDLCISYIDTNLPINARQAKLAQEYYFLCACERCIHEKVSGSTPKITYPDSQLKSPRNKNRDRKKKLNLLLDRADEEIQDDIPAHAPPQISN